MSLRSLSKDGGLFAFSGILQSMLNMVADPQHG
jgi:hypothetical protein